MTKAWSMVRVLHETYPNLSNGEIAAFLQLCDDGQWDAIRQAAGVKATESATTCTVSREVKAIIYAKLRGPRRGPRSGGADVFASRRIQSDQGA